jgi:tripartite-type tricarboxylate transporter receptor subunit TctC
MFMNCHRAEAECGSGVTWQNGLAREAGKRAGIEAMMTTPTRVAVLALAAMFAMPAWAQDYPSKPIRFIVGFAAGGGADIIARLMGQWLSDRLGQTVVVENRPGAATNIAVEAVARSPADGYTLLLIGSPQTINANLYANLNYNFSRDIAPVGGISRVPNVLEVNLSVPVKTVPEFIAYAKANGGKINMASGGIGTSPHVAGELFKMMTGVDMIHVPYRGDAPAVTDLIAGQMQVMFGVMPTSIEQIKAGNLRALAVTTDTRSPLLPDVPTLSDFLPGYEASTWNGIGVPKNTSSAIVEKLNKEINAALADPKTAARLKDLGGTLIPGTPDDLRMLIASETDKWRKVIKFANIKPE